MVVIGVDVVCIVSGCYIEEVILFFVNFKFFIELIEIDRIIDNCSICYGNIYI